GSHTVAAAKTKIAAAITTRRRFNMKKKLSVGIASLAVLAMAGSAYAAEVPSSSNASNTVKVSAAEAQGKAVNSGLQAQIKVIPASSAVATEAVTGGQAKQ